MYKAISLEEADTLFHCGVEFEYTSFHTMKFHKYADKEHYPDCVPPTMWVDRINRLPYFRVQTE